MSEHIQPWYEREPDRFKVEKKKLEAIGFSLDDKYLEKQQVVRFHGSLQEDPERKLTLEFPHSFPSDSPKCIDDGTKLLLARHHRNSTREFCIFGTNSSRWYARLSARDALNEVKYLLTNYSDKSTTSDSVKDSYPEPVTTQLNYKKLHCVLIPPPISQLFDESIDQPVKGSFKIFITEETLGSNNSETLSIHRAVIQEAKIGEGNEKFACKKLYVNSLHARKPKNQQGKLFFIPKVVKPSITFDELKCIAEKEGFVVPTSYEWYAFIVKEESGIRTNHRYAWLIFHQAKNATPKPVQSMPMDVPLENLRVPGLAWLKNKKVAVIGCGSIGSKIAVALASTGISHFSLIDPDHMEPANLIRHETGPLGFGYPKVKTLAAQVIYRNPEAEVLQFPYALGSIHSFQDESALLEQIEKCDLVINATGLDKICRYINDQCYEFSKPAIHVSVTNGAWSGEAIRVIPGKTPCWLCWDSQFADHDPPEEPKTDGALFAPGCDQPTFTGTTYDIGVFADLATSFAVDTLRITEGMSPMFKQDYLLWKWRDHDGNLLLKTDLLHVNSRSTGCSLRCDENTL